MYCKECGANITEGAAFCRQCGATVHNSTPAQEKTSWRAESQGRGERERQNNRHSRQPRTLYMGYGAENQGYDRYNSLPVKNYDPSKDYTPIGMWGYFGYQILFAIPVIGFIMTLIFALGGTRNINLRNYARSTFCLFIILLVAVLLIVMVSALS